MPFRLQRVVCVRPDQGPQAREPGGEAAHQQSGGTRPQQGGCGQGGVEQTTTRAQGAHSTEHSLRSDPISGRRKIAGYGISR